MNIDQLSVIIGIVGFALIITFAVHLRNNPPTSEPECAGYNIEVMK